MKQIDATQPPVRLESAARTCALLLAFCVVVLIPGCVTSADRRYDEAPGPNNLCYHNGMQGLSLPTLDTIKKASTGNWRFNQPLDEVWKACLDVASQYQAIVAINKTSQGRSLCVIKGRDAHIAASDQATETVFGSYYDQWLAIAIFKDSALTGMSLAIFDPVNGQTRSSASTEQALFAQMLTQLTSTSSWIAKFVDADRNTRQPRVQKNTVLQAQSTPPIGFETRLGDWIAKGLRLDLGVVTCPEVNRSLDVVAQSLKDAAGVSGQAPLVRILASPNISAFALPNGEIYVTSGLLDATRSIDEIAGVLAHEIFHLKNRDVAKELRLQAQAIAATDTLRFLCAIAGVDPTVVPDVTVGNANAPNGRPSTVVHLQDGMVEDFSADIELQADNFSCETLYLAGFNPDANLAFLDTLKEKQSNPLAHKTMPLSNYMNIQPGLDHRILNMKHILGKMKSGVTQ